MSLAVPPWYFNNVSYLSDTGNPGSSPGCVATAGANNVDSSWQDLVWNSPPDTAIFVVNHDIHYLVLGFSGFSSSTANGQTLMEIQVDPTGAGGGTEVLVDGLICGMTTPYAAASAGMTMWYHFPVWVKAGSSLRFRARTRHTSAFSIGRVMGYGFGDPSRPEMWWCGRKIESLGLDKANSQGTDVAPAGANSWGSWTSIGSPTSFRYGAIQAGINGATATTSPIGYALQVGNGDRTLPGLGQLYRLYTSLERGTVWGGVTPNFCDIAAGTQMQARLYAGAASGQTLNVALYGVGG